MESRIVWLHSLSSVHVGSGDAVDVIDLPVVRETVTHWPYLPGSALKGVFRDACSGLTDEASMNAAFGKIEDAGSLWFADAKLLCFPVRSLYGTFAWVTCPLALSRHARDLKAAGLAALPSVPNAPGDMEIIASTENVISDKGKDDKVYVYLEDLDLTLRTSADAVADALAAKLADALFSDDADWRDAFMGRFAVVSDTVFTFLTETCTEVSAHIKIQEQTKTVQNGGLWYEESVPAEAIFTMPLIAAPRNGTEAAGLLGVVAKAAKSPIQIGGKASIGRGMMRVRLTGGAA